MGCGLGLDRHRRIDRRRCGSRSAILACTEIVAAVAMGVAISGMHYRPCRPRCSRPGPPFITRMDMAGLGQTNLAAGGHGHDVSHSLLALVASQFDRRFALLAESEAVALRESEERFRALYSKTPLPLVSLDAEGRIENASETWLDLSGYRRERSDRRRSRKLHDNGCGAATHRNRLAAASRGGRDQGRRVSFRHQVRRRQGRAAVDEARARPGRAFRCVRSAGCST